jgi:hypothetical protein
MSFSCHLRLRTTAFTSSGSPTAESGSAGAPGSSLRASSHDLPNGRSLPYLAAGQPAFAEKDFRCILANQRLDPTSSFYPLAWLQLGRALAAEGNRAGAIDAYEHFFTVWAHADHDAMYFKQARQEFTALQTVPLAK